MGFPFWDGESRQRIEQATLWTERWKAQIVSEESEKDNAGRPPGYPQPVRGILLQSIWGGQVGKMQCLALLPQKYSFFLSVNGMNVANPATSSAADVSFKIKVFGVKADDTLQELFTTVEVGLLALPEEIATAVINGAQGVNLPVGRVDVKVGLGNPGEGTDFVPYPPIGPPVAAPVDSQPEVDKTTTPTETYIGAWLVTFTGQLTKQFKGLTAQVIPMASYILTEVVSYPSFDSLTDRVISVRDIYGRPASYPWKVGSKVACIYFPDMGFGIIGSNFHDMTELPL